MKSPKKKVCFVVYDMSVIGGAEQASVNVANALSFDYKVDFYSICDNKRSIPYDLNEGITITYGVKGASRVRTLVFKNFAKFIKYINKNRFDVIICVGAYTGTIVSLTRFFTTAQYVFCDHGALMNQW